MRSLVIRADGGPGVGSGHLSRQLALVQAWNDGGGEALLASDSVPDDWSRRYAAEGVGVVPAAACPAGADWIVFDGYAFGPEHAGGRALASHVAVVDDHGAVGSYDADVVIDHNLDATATSYRRRPPTSELLLGTRYALLRRPFRESERIDVKSNVTRVLVGLGGSPPAAALALVESALLDARLAEFEPVLLEGVDDPVPLMRTVDLAVVAAGTTTWELCRLGVPSVLLVLAENQAPVSAAMARHGAAIDAGWFNRLDRSQLVATLAGVQGDEVRRRLGATAARLVDGRGALRVASRLRSVLLAIRRVRADDARMLWEWANEPGVRRAAFSEDPIPWEEHLRWFESKLIDPSCHHYVAEDAGRPVAQVRFDVDQADAEIDVSLSVDQRGRGLGPAVIDAAVRAVFAAAPVERVVARVRPENRASAIAFGDAGFEQEGERSAGARTWLQYARLRNGRPA